MAWLWNEFQPCGSFHTNPSVWEIWNETSWLQDTWHGCENLGTAYEFSTRDAVSLICIIDMQRIILIAYYWFLRAIFSSHSTSKDQRDHIIYGCSRDYGCLCCLSLISCLFRTLFEGEAICFVLCSSPNAILFCECVSSDKNSSWAIISHDDVRRLGLFLDTDWYHLWNWRRISPRGGGTSNKRWLGFCQKLYHRVR